MPNRQRYFRNQDGRRQIARVMQRRLIGLVSFLAVILVALVFKVGESWWPLWMTDRRAQFIGLVLLVILCVTALSPILVEADTNPRPLSGPGKNPKGPRLS